MYPLHLNSYPSLLYSHHLVPVQKLPKLFPDLALGIFKDILTDKIDMRDKCGHIWEKHFS